MLVATEASLQVKKADYCLSCRPRSPCLLINTGWNVYNYRLHQCSLPNNLDSDGESYLVSTNVLVGEESELPPASRQAFWNL